MKSTVSKKYITKSLAETEELGERLGKSLTSGTVIAMYGDIGVGKTTFVHGLAKGLGISERVTSPTFAIVNEYNGNLRLCHFDMYRISCVEELYDIGWTDYLNGQTVCAIEWSENIEDALPGDRRAVFADGCLLARRSRAAYGHGDIFAGADRGCGGCRQPELYPRYAEKEHGTVRGGHGQKEAAGREPE